MTAGWGTTAFCSASAYALPVVWCDFEPHGGGRGTAGDTGGWGAHPAGILDDGGDGQHDVVGVDQAHGAAGVACKCAVHRVVGQDLAVDAVVGDGGDGADEVGGVDVLDVSFLELLLQQVPHPHTHILQDGVAALVCLLLALGQNLLQATSMACVLE